MGMGEADAPPDKPKRERERESTPPSRMRYEVVPLQRTTTAIAKAGGQPRGC